MKLQDEPSSTDVRGLVVSVDYDKLDNGIWAATLYHRSLGKVTSHETSPSKAREAARRRLSEQMDEMMAGHAQRHAHEV